MAGDDSTAEGGTDRERRAREIAEEAERTRNPGNPGGGGEAGASQGGEDPGTGLRHWEPGEGPGGEGDEARPSPQGKGRVRGVAASDVEQPEIAGGGPVPGLQPGEKVERGPWIPPVEVDPPAGEDLPRDAAGEPDAVRRQKEEGGP